MYKISSAVSDLLTFLDNSPVNFLAAREIVARLDAAGFSPLDPRDAWNLKPGDRRYVVKNSSAVMAFVVGSGGPAAGCHIISAHSDSPGFRIKPNPEMLCDGNVLKINTEVYGGPILYTWFDRPLSVAGRVVLRTSDPLNPRIASVHIRRPLMVIPHLAIHFNRAVNEGNPLSKQKDMLPVLGVISDAAGRDGAVLRLVADELGVDPAEILDFDLSLYDVTPACITGLNGEFINSGRLDDLSMAHAAVTALIEESRTDSAYTRVAAIFDNEETGSGTKQGAASPLLADILKRVTICLGGNEEDYLRSVASSFLISADNAHAIHPNYPEKHDPTNHPVIGGGPVIKINANCKYMTDAESAAVYATICERAAVPVQYFVNHSDMAGGSTLGNILTSQLSLRGVDMGAAIWGMHSCRETASVADHDMILASFRQFMTL